MISEKISNIEKALSFLSKEIDSAIFFVRHDENMRNLPECRDIESKICNILNFHEALKNIRIAVNAINKVKKP